MVRNAFRDIFTDQAFCDGQKFENYVDRLLFPHSRYDCLEKSHEFIYRGRYIYSNLNPDFKFRDRETGYVFWVECKYRSCIDGDKLEWCNYDQLVRYNNIAKQCPVYVLIGNGGVPSNPDYLFLLPIEEAKYTGLFESVLFKFEIERRSPVMFR